MAKHILKIRQVDKIVFDAIKNGQKVIEAITSLALGGWLFWTSF